MFPRLAVLYLIATGCGSPEASLPVPIRVSPETTAGAAAPAPADDVEPASRHGYADAPLTPFADRMTDLVIAALTDRPLPEVGIPVEPLRGGDRVELRDDLPAVPDRLDVLAFGIEMDVLFGAPASSKLHLVLLLSPTGLRLAYASVATGHRGELLPRELGELEVAAAQVLEVLRAGQGEALLVGEAERQWLGDDRLYRELVRESPDAQTLARIAELVRTSGSPVAYRLDDVGLLLRGSDGAWYGAELDFLHRGGAVVVLENGPLVTLRPLHPE